MSCIQCSFLSRYLLPVEYLHRYSISFYFISKLKKQSVPKLDSNSSVSQCHQMSILNVTMSPDEYRLCHQVTRWVLYVTKLSDECPLCHQFTRWIYSITQLPDNKIQFTVTHYTHRHNAIHKGMFELVCCLCGTV